METLQAAYEESYNAAMESIDGQLGLFNELDGSAKTSIDNLIGTLQGQVSYMETYAANIQKAMELGVDEGLIKKAVRRLRGVRANFGGHCGGRRGGYSRP